MSTVSQREFAKHIGRSHVWVSKLVRAGKIPLDAQGRIPLDEGLIAYEASQRVGYDGNRTHNAQQREKKPKPSGTSPAKEQPAGKASAKPRQPVPQLPDDDESAIPSTGALTTAKVNEAFNRARTAEKTFQAKLKELEYKEAQDLLIKRDDVIADARHVAEELRGLLFSVGPRIAPLCEGKAAREIETIIEDAINDALTALQKSRFAKEREK